jgi:selenocysteine-specific elongation factor
MRVIGTAGHVDHGKSTLVEAMTGTHPDRLQEERDREMTIDLGFAWMQLPSGEDIGIVDVPGHRDFIENMLAGVGGIDASLFVVAADEGVMPQTREHLAILNLLQIQGGVVALTKIDMIDDSDGARSDWLDLVEEDLLQVFSGTVLDGAPIVRVSAPTWEGVPELLEALDECLTGRPARPDLGRPRLPVDRVFTIAGFGTVVTGTLSDGHLRVGDEVHVLPGTQRGRVRGLQTHKHEQQVAVPGSRTAVNISGVAKDQIMRGDVVAHPGDYETTRRLDVKFHLLPDVSQPLRHNTEVKLFIGAAEVVARVRLLGVEVLNPGEDGWLQLELSLPVVAIRGDRYILRRPSPGETMGGGIVADPRPKGRHKRFAEGLVERLEAFTQGTPADVLMQALLSLGAAPVRQVVEHSSLENDAAADALDELVQNGQIVILEEIYGDLSPSSSILLTSQGYWGQLAAGITAEVENYHQDHPLRLGMPREELKSRLDLDTRLFNAMMNNLVAQGELAESGPVVLHPGHEIRFTQQQEQAAQRLLARFSVAPYSPPSVKDAQAEVGEEVYYALCDLGKLLQVSPEVAFRTEDYEKMVVDITGLLETQGTLSAAQVRDHFNTSRRYVLALLEYLDSVGVTVREGDVRRLRK